MKEIYNGNTPTLYEFFLKGAELEYRPSKKDSWRKMPVYSGKPNDIYRVSNAKFEFRISTTVRKYTFCDRIERYTEESYALNDMIPQQWYNSNEGLAGKHLEWVFVDNKLTAVNIIGED